MAKSGVRAAEEYAFSFGRTAWLAGIGLVATAGEAGSPPSKRWWRRGAAGASRRSSGRSARSPRPATKPSSWRRTPPASCSARRRDFSAVSRAVRERDPRPPCAGGRERPRSARPDRLSAGRPTRFRTQTRRRSWRHASRATRTDSRRDQGQRRQGRLAGLGALATAEEQGGKLFRSLVRKGEQYEKKGKSQFEKLKAKVENLADAAKAKAEGAWEKVEEKAGDVEERWDDRMVAPCARSAFRAQRDRLLTHRVEEPTSLVEKKVGTSSAKSRRPAAKKAAKKATRKTAKKSATGKAATRRSR
ncbi:MAG: phasin family protein [Thermoanaerobaculia bacterium]